MLICLKYANPPNTHTHFPSAFGEVAIVIASQTHEEVEGEMRRAEDAVFLSVFQ